MNIRLEYSQTEGKLKQAKATDKIDVANGYKTLCCFVQQERASCFIEAIYIKYSSLGKTNRSYPSLATLKHELCEFLAKDLIVLEENMKRTFKRRTTFFK